MKEGLGMTLITTLALQETDRDMHFIKLLNDDVPTFDIYLLARESVHVNDARADILQVIREYTDK